MTVFCWDGKYLAVDSRRTTFKAADSNGMRQKVRTMDEAEKIQTDYRGVKFRGSTVLAVVKAGNVKTTNFLRDLIRQQVDLEAKNFSKEQQYRLGSLFIVTRKTAWYITLSSSKGLSILEVKDGQTFAGGTGGKIGKFVMDVFGLTAQLAVCATTLHMSCCGGPVRYAKCRGLIARMRPKVRVVKFDSAEILRYAVFSQLRNVCKGELLRT